MEREICTTEIDKQKFQKQTTEINKQKKQTTEINKQKFQKKTSFFLTKKLVFCQAENSIL